MTMFEEDAKAEQGFLGCILKEPDLMDEYTGQFDKNDFVYIGHFMLWDTMTQLHKENNPITIATLHEQFRVKNAKNDFGEMGYIKSLRDAFPSSASAPYYAGKIKLNAVHRKVKAYAEKLLDMANGREKETPEELIGAADDLLLRLRSKETSTMKSLAEKRKDFENTIRTKADLIKTGQPAFDEWAGGIPRSCLYILSGRSHVGKTAKAVQMAYNMAKQEAGPVLFWSQEMTHEQIMERLTSNISGVNYKKIATKSTTDEEYKKVMQAYDHVSQYPFYIDDTPRVAIGSVKATANMFKRKYGKIGGLFIDYLSMMDIPQEKNQTTAKAIGEVVFRSKDLAKFLKCPVILLAQINRQGAEGKPEPHHLKESGDIEQAADFIEILWKDENAIQENFTVVKSAIVKGRMIGTNDFEYKFTGGIQRYEDYKAPAPVGSYEPNQEGLVSWSKGKGKGKKG